MEKEYLSTIRPVLYFEADWPSKSYKFDLGVQLIKADKTKDPHKAVKAIKEYFRDLDLR